MDRVFKILIRSLFFIKLEVNDGKTGLLFGPLNTLSKHEGTRHPLGDLDRGRLLQFRGSPRLIVPGLIPDIPRCLLDEKKAERWLADSAQALANVW